jgi:hypothetical protein
MEPIMGKIFAQSKEARDEPITLPVTCRDGKIEMYVIEPLDGQAWMRLVAIDKAQRRARAGLTIAPEDQAELDTMSEREFGELVVGEDNFNRLLDSTAHPDLILAVITTAQTFHIRGEDAAENAWKLLAVDPPQPVPNRAEKRRTSSRARVKVASTNGAV